MPVKFAVFTDLHFDHVFDGYKRLERFVMNIKDSDVEFIINLGDFCKPIDDNIMVMDLLKSIGKPCYHVIGNHDSDAYPKKQVLEFLGQNSSYYSFVCSDVKFIVLDTCFIKQNDEYIPYDRKNYNNTKGVYPVLPEEQLDWLKHELSDCCSDYVILSHHSLENDFRQRGVQNRHEVQDIINKLNSQNKKVILCINGHDHADSMEVIEKTHYFGLNGMSYIWFGDLINKWPYEKEVYQKYPGLKDIVLYKESLYATVCISGLGGFEIIGMDGSYHKTTPEDLDIKGDWNGRKISSKVSSFKVV